jgi:Rv2525c-like, glycoside hydrolase-like domain
MGCMRMAARARAIIPVRKGQAAGLLVAVALAWVLSFAAAAWAATIRFEGRSVRAPSSWPVYRLSRHPGMCVRLDRRAVYLGTPAANQRCPAAAIGPRRAILVDPRAAAARASRSPSGAIPPGGASTAPASAGYFTGLGFDACSTPSTRTMSAWSGSPFEAIGVYIGGLNRACTQTNLTAGWVSTEIAAGWHLIPTYVGLQAPTSSCGSCGKLSTRLARASAQGVESAEDAVQHAAAVSIGRGSPIYFDMEAYTRTASATRATLTFLLAWTEELHALGYRSGVYSSSSSGIADLASELETGYMEPDDVWTANWNGQENTADPFLPSSAWSPHSRIHQFRGAHNDTYGGQTINIDSDYVDGATAGSPAPAAASLPPLAILGVRASGATVSTRIRCGWAPGEVCSGQMVLRARVRIVRHAGRRVLGSRVVRVGIARRGFRLAGGRAHTFRVGLNERGRPLLRRNGSLEAQLLVAIPGARASRAVQLRRP